VIDSGSLAKAIRASGSVPFVFEPISIHGKMLIDGGAVNPVPVSAVKNMGVDIVIGVDIYDSMFKKNIPPQKLSRIDVVNLSYHLLLSKLAEHDSAAADLIITPQIDNLAFDPFSRFINNQQTIDQGEAAMDQQIPQLETLLR
jgi:NTE family protein